MERHTYDNTGSHMYYRDYTKEPDARQAVRDNHHTTDALMAKMAAKLRGRAGRFRGKNGSRENNKARGGNMAR